jgi:hypothetical protein
VSHFTPFPIVYPMPVLVVSFNGYVDVVKVTEIAFKNGVFQNKKKALY